jgi:hypothetical protein
MGRECSMEGQRGIRIEFWYENQKEIDHWEEIDVGGRIILK